VLLERTCCRSATLAIVTSLGSSGQHSVQGLSHSYHLSWAPAAPVPSGILQAQAPCIPGSRCSCYTQGCLRPSIWHQSLALGAACFISWSLSTRLITLLLQQHNT
jgi:hypothetical protein